MLISILLIKSPPFHQLILALEVFLEFYMQILPVFYIFLKGYHHLQKRILGLVVFYSLHQSDHILFIVSKLGSNNSIDLSHQIDVFLVAPG
jgi:hypothetical protein